MTETKNDGEARTQEETHGRFEDLNLSKPVLSALTTVGYESPTAIQARTIPLLLEGRDVIGQAQTGTGKTAAFALPLLSRLDVSQNVPQVMVLTPTRELAIQVAEAFQTYAAKMKGFHVLPVYGGSDYRGQLIGLRRGAQVIVGTPGRVMDHIRRETLVLDGLSALVLDEADEMLRMGFIEDVTWIMDQVPESRQVALFSATMPGPIRQIADRYLENPATVTIERESVTAETIRQRFWIVAGYHKLDALTRILEFEQFDAMIIFVRTKTATVELADKLSARGYAASAINGDMAQNARERTVDALKSGKIDILVATDVAARGLDVERISHVINYDIPHDSEAYVHRIGRTGRAGRTGEAILFVQPREKRLLFAIERATKQRVERLQMPTTEAINDKRVAKFKDRITENLQNAELGLFTRIIEQYQAEHDLPGVQIAAALAKMVQGDEPLLLEDSPADRRGRERPPRKERGGDRPRERAPKKKRSHIDQDLATFKIAVGREHGVEPRNIVGAIANEAGLDSQYIGRVEIYDDHSLVDLPADMPPHIQSILFKARVAGQRLSLKPLKDFNAKTSKKKKTTSRDMADKDARSSESSRGRKGQAPVKRKKGPKSETATSETRGKSAEKSGSPRSKKKNEKAARSLKQTKKKP